MPNITGSVTKSLFLNEVESHKLHLEFEASETIQAGSLVELDVDGRVSVATVATTGLTAIGIALQTRTVGQMVTIGCKGFAVIWAESNTAALVAGPVKWVTHNATTGYHEFDDDTVTVANQYGWSLDAGDDGDVIRVLVKN
jgi:hypothetical protein